ncbi:hypothetical protein C8F01DRAFT_1370216 [Mycena amicta]|nr:hypothetical protein C8F01DRAFT_1370216 [Mycena amicta]
MPTSQPCHSRRIQQRLESKPLQLPPTSVLRSVCRKDAKGYLYFCVIRRGRRLVVKIGCTNNWKRCQLQHYRKCRVQKQNWILVYEVALRYRMEKILHQYFKDVEPSWLGNHKQQILHQYFKDVEPSWLGNHKCCAFCTTRHCEFFDLERSGGIEHIQRVMEGYLLEEDGVVNRCIFFFLIYLFADNFQATPDDSSATSRSPSTPSTANLDDLQPPTASAMPSLRKTSRASRGSSGTGAELAEPKRLRATRRLAE